MIGPRREDIITVEARWIRQIGQASYRFLVMTRSNGYWSVRVERLNPARDICWRQVHNWSGTEEGVEGQVTLTQNFQPRCEAESRVKDEQTGLSHTFTCDRTKGHEKKPWHRPYLHWDRKRGYTWT